MDKNNIRAALVVLGVVAALIGGSTAIILNVDHRQTCLQWTENYRLDAEVCWGYGEDEREFAPANEKITEAEFEEIVTRFYENR